MNHTNDQTDIKVQSPDTPAPKRGVWRTMAIAGIALAAVSWLVFIFAPVAAAIIALAGAVASSLGVKAGRGCLRDLAVTGIIATVVLVVVFGIFNWGVPYAIGRL